MNAWLRDSLIVGAVNLVPVLYAASDRSWGMIGVMYFLPSVNVGLCLAGLVHAGVRFGLDKKDIFPDVIRAFLLPFLGLVLAFLVLSMVPTKGGC